MPGLPKQCIFCGGHPLSEEDYWPRWLRRHIAASHRRTRHTVTMRQYRHQQPSNPHVISGLGNLNSRGAPSTRTLPVACIRCNNGWMSNLQTRSQSTLLPLARGEWPLFDIFKARSLAAWVTMFAMVWEQATPLLVSTSTEEREQLRLLRDPLPKWVVLAGLIEGPRWNYACHHRGLAEVSPPGIPHQCNAGSLTLVVGHAILHAAHVRNFDAFPFDPREYARYVGLRLIWPERTFPIHKPQVVLSEAAFDRISFVFGELMQSAFP